jgi:hypothetical protein
LNQAVEGRLVKVRSPLSNCLLAPTSAECTRLFTALRNPYYIGDEPGLTQTLGWVDAWTFAPSVYAVAAQQTSDIVAAVRSPAPEPALGRQRRRSQLSGHIECR